jgi:hypothetical protein
VKRAAFPVALPLATEGPGILRVVPAVVLVLLELEFDVSVTLAFTVALLVATTEVVAPETLSI